jgi:UDP-N-acetylglucosamine diphosphorylase/glucosamine-1-phosphate N-acetyltransferase
MAVNIILFDDNSWGNLLPLTFTRPVAEIRVGILKIREKWEVLSGVTCHFLTQQYLSKKYPVHINAFNLFINSSILPDTNLAIQIFNLKPNECLLKNNDILAICLNKEAAQSFDLSMTAELNKIEYEDDVIKINYPWDIFTHNGEGIKRDFELLTHGRKSAAISKTNNLLGAENIFFEEGAKAEFATINATTGPVYIGKDAEIMEGAIIRGPFALCNHSTVKMGAKIYGATTFGPHCKIGGEVNNSVIFGLTNKAHDGFLGNAVLGEWCNLGADTNNSNLKNNYAIVKCWNYPAKRFVNTGLQFCGLIMGDHSKSGINTMFNTGTVVGVSANLFGAGFPRNFVPSFSWGGAQGYETFMLPKAFEVAQLVMERRGTTLDETEKEILSTIFQLTAEFRKY